MAAKQNPTDAAAVAAAAAAAAATAAASSAVASLDMFNFPLPQELRKETSFFLYHPLAFFNLQSRFCHLRSMMDHKQVFERHFGLTREKITGEPWGPDAVVEPVRQFAMAAAGDDETLAIDPLRPDDELQVEMHVPAVVGLQNGKAIFNATGADLVSGRPALQTIFPLVEQIALLREDPTLPEDPAELIRTVFSDDAVRNRFHVARLLARLPSMWGWVLPDRKRVRFEADVPQGEYSLLPGDWAVLVVDRSEW